MMRGFRTLYTSYGGLPVLVSSPYFWAAIIFSLLVTAFPSHVSWAEIALSTLPSLIGFGIASFAILFAILSPEQVKVLLKRKGGGVSAMVKVAAIFLHAILVQVMCTVFSGINLLMTFDLKMVASANLASSQVFLDGAVFIEVMVDFLGAGLLFYSWFLVIAVILSIMTLFQISSNAASGVVLKKTSQNSEDDSNVG